MHKLLALVNDDDERRMFDILAYVHMGVVDHVVIHAYLESCTRDRYDGRSMTLYHPINVEWFPEIDSLVRNLPLNVLVTIKAHGTLMMTMNRFVIVMVTVHFCRHSEKNACDTFVINIFMKD
jgi:hypothetical protein